LHAEFLEIAMTTADLNRTVLPDEKEIAAAVESRRQLAAFLSTKQETQRIELVDGEQQRQVVELPTFALRLLGEILSELALGNAVKVVPIHAELTTQEGADLLNVSRPHLVKLLDEGVIPHTKTGRHRRVKFADLMAYKAQRDHASRTAMDELAAQAQKLGMGYE
jgi:excisionase family DNA binding protein